MKLFFKSALVLSFLFFNSILAQNPLVNFPAISPNGQAIAFNYQGDIWTSDVNGQNAKRLTIHEAYDTNPIWSFDGKSIAFTSNRYGNNDIYVMASVGGIPKRITYHSTNDNITDYTKNGDILFSTRRDFAQVEWENEIHIVSEKGGTPYRYMRTFGHHATLSPNGKFIAFVKGSCRIQREDYKGSANRDIWLYNIEKDSYIQLTTFEGQDFYPQWGSDTTIYFQSARSGRYNIHKLDINSAGEKQGNITSITSFKDMGVFSFHISRNGKDLVMVKGDEVFLVDATSKKQKEVKINISSDYRLDPIEHKTYSNNIRDIALSPNGNYSALVIRGEIFIRENKKEKSRTVNISKSSYRDRMPVWISDSTLVFVSDRDGQNDLYLVKSDDDKEANLFKTLKHKVIRLSKTNEHESNPVLSPNGTSLVFNRGRGKLVVAGIDTKGKLSNETILLDGWNNARSVSWSPDSKWLAYSLQDLDFNAEIYIHKADNSRKPVNISMHPKQDRGAIWSSDGKKLMFSSNRNNSDYDVWFTWLNKKDWEKTTRDWEEDADDTSKKKDEKDTDKDDEEKQKDVVEDISIDFQDIHERQVQVTSFVGGEFGRSFSKDGKTIYYTTGSSHRGDAKVASDLFKISWEGKDKKAITKDNSKPSNIIVDKKYSKIFMTKSSGSLNSINLSNDESESLPISAKLDIDYNLESNQIFEEAWKAINDGFYDPDFHGKNWKTLKKTYKPLVMKASTRTDFQNMFNWMLGQVNASHMGFRSGEKRENLQEEKTGLLGLELFPDKNGSLKVASVVNNMPGDRSASKLYAGDIITAINGTKLTKNLNIYSLLEGTSDEKIYLEIHRSGSVKEIVIRPKSSNRVENYNAWVKERKQLTDTYSNGKLGYIHIQGMNWQSFERFERELTAAGHGKEGVVIDVRFNGGGWTTDYLMAVLSVKQHAYTVPRGAATDLEKEHKKFKNHYPFSERLPLAAWTKPSIALCNQSSYSNAEIFSHAYKALNIGTLVGVPTFGAVISTGSASLIDGSRVRMPFRGWYVKESQSNMELGPAVPDVLVFNNPDDKSKKVDTQLKKAVDVLLTQIK